MGNYYVVVLDNGEDYLFEISRSVLGDQVAAQMANTYKEAYLAGWDAAEQAQAEIDAG